MDKNKNITRTLTVTRATGKIYTANESTFKLEFLQDVVYTASGYKRPEKVKAEILKKPEFKGMFVSDLEVTYERNTYSLPTSEFIAAATIIATVTLTAEEMEAESAKEVEA